MESINPQYFNNGSPASFTYDDTGASLGQYSYKPYGKLLSSSTPVSGNPFTYTAREDDGTGLYYYRARYYDPTLELFISQDPLGDAQRYVGGNPLKYKDPLGLVDVLFKFTTNSNGDINFWSPNNHAMLVTEQLLANDPLSRQVYELIPYPYTGDVSSPGTIHNVFVSTDQQLYLVELSDSFSDDSLFSRAIFTPWFFIPGLGTNCSGYAGGELDKYLERMNQPSLLYWEKNSPSNLFIALRKRGLIKKLTILK